MTPDIRLNGASVAGMGWLRETISFPVPQSQTNTIVVPGRNSPIRYTEALGRVSYQPRSFSLTFSMLGTRTKYDQMIAEIANRYAGQLVKVSTSEEPELYAIGTLEITSEYDPISGKGQLVIASEDADSYRYHIDETVVNLTGSGTLSLIGKLSGASSSPYGNYRLNALNTNFLGRIKVGLRLTTYVTANDGYQGLYLADGRSLGGTLQEFDPKALVLTQWARLVPEGSVTLSAASRRGVFIDGGGGFNVGTKSKTSVPYVLRLETALALNGELRKDGVGTLDLAGTTAFGADAMGMTPESGKNIFAVSGGVVRVSSAGAIDGFETHFAAGTSLELAIDLGNEDLTRQGIRNAKTDTPFVLPAGETKLPLAVRNVGSAPADGTKEFSVGFVTVSAAAVDSVKAMLSNTPPKVFKGYRGRWLEPQADEQTGAVTLAALYEKTGMCLILR